MAIILACLGVFVKGAAAHELRPAIADVSVGAEQVTLRIDLALEALVAEIDVSEIENTDASPNAARYDALRAEPPAALEAELRAAWPSLSANFLIQAGETALTAEIAEVEIPEIGNVELVRDSVLTLVSDLPEDGSALRVGWTANNGPIVIRQVDAGEGAYAGLLEGGELSAELPRPEGGAGGLWGAFLDIFR
jgi:hypothetical protein